MIKRGILSTPNEPLPCEENCSSASDHIFTVVTRQEVVSLWQGRGQRDLRKWRYDVDGDLLHVDLIQIPQPTLTLHPHHFGKVAC